MGGLQGGRSSFPGNTDRQTDGAIETHTHPHRKKQLMQTPTCMRERARQISLPSQEALGECGELAFPVLDEVSLLSHQVIELLSFL